jgi:predicted transcriptional regulator
VDHWLDNPANVYKNSYKQLATAYTRGKTRLTTLETVARVAAKIAPGRLPSFAEAHVIEALEDISSLGTVGRLRLSKDLDLGEGETRTLVRHLKNEGLIEVSRPGISLSDAGRKLLSSVRTVLSEQVEIQSTPLTVGRFNVAVRVAGMKNSVKYGLEQRDAAIKAGAKGATTLVFTKNGLIMPGTGEDVSKSGSSIVAALSRLSLTVGDVVIIGSADEKIKAELGVKTAALELLKSRGG